ncbi:MAG: 3-dehydroquinate synthase [Firmicutes bacterium]|nr:3-dehydroquinate synthase [Bacillota bacterium]
MENLEVDLAGCSYRISFGPQVWEQVKTWAARYDRVLLVTDTNVEKLYGKRLPFPRAVLEPGEENKSMAFAQAVLEKMCQEGLSRDSLVIALGGGVIGDLAGFCAAIYQRGLAYLQIPTTLVAQVDSSIGGKTALNTSWGKNLIGAFHQPKGVFIDPAVLKTLPASEIINGLGEIFKYGIIGDPPLFSAVQKNLTAFFNADIEVMAPLIRRCCALKSAIVSKDEKDQGARRILNYGHTLGHALEALTAFQAYSHGEAVLIGMLYEASLALELGLLSPDSYQKIKTGLQQIELDWDLSFLDLGDLVQALLKDKKNRRGLISFLLPRRLGEMEEVLLSPEKFRESWVKLEL